MVKLRQHIFHRSLDLLLDPRLPHAFPYTIWRTWRYRSQLPANVREPIHIA